jgi:hypothetical protein
MALRDGRAICTHKCIETACSRSDFPHHFTKHPKPLMYLTVLSFLLQDKYLLLKAKKTGVEK